MTEFFTLSFRSASDNHTIRSNVVFFDGHTKDSETDVKQRSFLVPLALLGLLVGVAAISFFAGDTYAVGTLSVRQVAPEQLAQAMKGDEFYSDFRGDTLVIRGAVASVYRGAGGMVLEFQTQADSETLCQLNNYPEAVHGGSIVTAVTEGANAQRVSSGVLLRDCVLETP